MKATRHLLLALAAATALSAAADTGTVTTPDGLTIAYDTELHYASITGFESDAKNITLELPSSVTCDGITLPVLSIGAEAFSNASELKGVVIPSSILSIATDAFTASGLRSLHIPATIQKLGSEDGGVALDCPDLVSFTMDPKSEVSMLYAYECRNNASLTEVSIGENVTKIDYAAFSKCPVIKVVKCYAPVPPELGVAPFREVVKENATLKVPAGSLDAYKESAWADLFGTIEALDNTPSGGDDPQTPENPGGDDPQPGSGDNPSDPQQPGTVEPTTIETVKVKIYNTLSGCAYTVDAIKGLPYTVEFDLPAGTVIRSIQLNGFDDMAGLSENVYTTPKLDANALIHIDMEKTTSLALFPNCDVEYRVSSNAGVVTVDGLAGGEQIVAVATDGRTLARLTAVGTTATMALPVGEPAVVSIDGKAVTIIP